VFSHDALVRALANHSEFVTDKGNEVFIDAIGRVELWLLGYDVTIAGEQKMKERILPPLPRSITSSIKKIDPVQEALDDFWEKFPSAKAGPGDKRFSVTFFRQIVELSKAPDDAADQELQDAVLACAKKHGGRLQENLAKIAANVWDGARRLLGWLRSAVKRIGQQVETELWNLARLVARGARESYEGALKAIDILHRGAVYLRDLMFPGSDPLLSVLGFRADFDSALFINANAPPGKVLVLVETETHEAGYFMASCRILRLIVSALRDVVRVVTVGAGLGWFVLLLALSRVARSVREIRDVVRGMDQFELGDATLYRNPVV
ncbi:MAG TPA: hypothetical protein VF104_06440, partial [Burkholderiales bacterium]